MDLKLTQTGQNKWLHNLLIFVTPVITVYVVAVIGIIQVHNGAVKLEDFIPNSFTLGAITLYILNTVLDYFRKLGGTK